MKNSILFVSLIALSLAILKIIFSIFSGSIIVLASALDSLIDVVFSLFNYIALRKIESPSNKYFNYGFGKLEGLASLFEGCAIFISGIYIIYQSIIKFINNEGVSNINQGLFVMIVSIFVTLFLVIYLKKISLNAKNNLIIKAEILHYKTDLFGNLGIIISLLIIEITGFGFLDSIIGCVLGIYICYNAFKITKSGFFMLLDRAIDDDLYKKIVDILDKNTNITSYHDIKSRISGDTIFLEYHLVFNEHISLFDAHSISNDIEQSIEKLSNAYKWTILVHFDSYDDSK
ncbi:hypothetical protein CCY99_06700 [Helicobacter sp. 16-1353]|uniref:cation diffusion facilitator family transporter n=1 Tax=Helicobacter sp. 16-1353 TaxID=2004996 RepID=UPI000DCF3D6F|nr:cation diffusion facilitator family transporter [Helicobacter sp. 16-1353]RAX53051.1 hypothetical protein CCY99_06700 [Helicobacter sp. 16-1353]